MKAFGRGLAALFLIIPLIACAQSPAPSFQEGVQYQRVVPPQPTDSGGKIEVLEFFWYGCPHCYHLEPTLDAWLKHKPANVSFVRIPAALSTAWELLARAYYAAEELNVLNKLHAQLFQAIHEQHTAMNTEDDVVAFFTAHGVAEADIRGAMHSFSVETKVRRAKQLGESYGISGVPTLIINGKYRTGVGMAGGGENLFKVVDYLISQESAQAHAH